MSKSISGFFRRKKKNAASLTNFELDKGEFIALLFALIGRAKVLPVLAKACSLHTGPATTNQIKGWEAAVYPGFHSKFHFVLVISQINVERLEKKNSK